MGRLPPTALKLQSSLLCSLPSDPRKPNGRQCVCDTLARCPAISSSVPFGPCQIWNTPSGPLWVGLLPPRTQHTGDTLGFRSTMSQGRRILHFSMVRSIHSNPRCFVFDSIHALECGMLQEICCLCGMPKQENSRTIT